MRLRTGGKDYYAIRAEDGKFYDRSGSGLARGFMRFPTVKQYRVSSNFNPRRLNPVTGRIAPHKGRFRRADRHAGAGGGRRRSGTGKTQRWRGQLHRYPPWSSVYDALYAHEKLLVKPGDKVKRGDRIGLSGSTGRSTGPHLHYEIWINNRAVNPLTAKLPRTEGLTGKDRSTYRRRSEKFCRS